MKINHNNILNYYQQLIKIIFLLIIFNLNNTYASENKIASVIEVSGEIIAITEEGEERELSLFDDIFLKDEILIGDDSSATIQFNDNTTIILKTKQTITTQKRP